MYSGTERSVVAPQVSVLPRRFRIGSGQDWARLRLPLRYQRGVEGPQALEGDDAAQTGIGSDYGRFSGFGLALRCFTIALDDPHVSSPTLP